MDLTLISDFQMFRMSDKEFLRRLFICSNWYTSEKLLINVRKDKLYKNSRAS